MPSTSRVWEEDEWLSIWDSYYRVRPEIDIRAGTHFASNEKRVPAAVSKTVSYTNTSTRSVIVYDTGLLGTTYVQPDKGLFNERDSGMRSDYLYIVLDIRCAKEDAIRWKRSLKMTSMSGHEYDDLIVSRAYDYVVGEDEKMARQTPHYLSARQSWMTVRFEIDIDLQALMNNECIGIDVAGLQLAITLDDDTERHHHRTQRRNPIRDMFEELHRRRREEGQVYAYYEQTSIQRCKYFCVGDTIYELRSSRVSPMKDRRVGPPGVYRLTPGGAVLIEPKDYIRNAIFDTAEEAKHYVDIVVRAAGDTEYQRKLHYDKLKADAEDRKAENERRRDKNERYDKLNDGLKVVGTIVTGIAVIVGALGSTKKK